MGKNILVTGATGNLGSAVVDRMADAGYQVAAITRGGTKLSGAPNVRYFIADLADEEQVNLLVDDLYRHFNSIDAAIMTAGGFASGRFEESGKTELDHMLAINFETSYYLTRRLLGRMMKQPDGGRFVYLGAQSALDPGAAKNAIAYSLSKSLLHQLSALVNAVGGKKKVVSCVIAPSIIDTKDNRESMPEADHSQWVSTGEIAAMIEFLCSDNGRSVRETVIRMYGNL